MKSENYSLLSEMLQEMHQEIVSIESEIEYNLRCIKEAEIYIKTFSDSEPDDFNVFSPRSSVTKDMLEVEKAKREKWQYSEANENLHKKKEVLQNRIAVLEKILQRENNSFAFLNVQEEDRQRIARDLHDTSLQNLAHLVHKIELSSMYIDKDPIQAKLELSIINKRLRETIDEIRNIIFDLRPMTFDDLGLKYALQRLLINLNEENTYEIVSDIDDVSCENNVVLVSVYRLAQECLNNIKKHAQANKVFFSCKNVDNQCILIIEDNGKGFENIIPDGQKHFGIFLMKERVELINGDIDISSELDKGTRVYIRIPLLN